MERPLRSGVDGERDVGCPNPVAINLAKHRDE
jgi:hypothetical protein